MAIFLPNHNNVRLLKSILHSDFGMRSSHASEAIAALIGYRSHASFLIGSRETSDVTAFDADFEAFENRATHLGYDRTSSEYLRLNFPNINWPDPAWKFFKRRDAVARDTWFYECQKREMPFLLISKAVKYCTVEWDHITMDPEYDRLVRKTAGGEMGRVLFRTYQLIASGVEPKSFFDGSSMVGSVTGLSEASARQIADAFAKSLFPGNLRASLAA